MGFDMGFPKEKILVTEKLYHRKGSNFWWPAVRPKRNGSLVDRWEIPKKKRFF